MTVFIDDMSTEKVSLLKGELADAKRRIAHLEGLVGRVEGVFDGDCSTECPFCKHTRGYSDTRHEPNCPAFTPEGEIK